MAYIVMVTISTAQAAVVARNPMFRQVRTARSLGRIPTALITKIERLIEVSAIANQRVMDGADESQFQRPPFSDGEHKNVIDKAKASRAIILKADPPAKTTNSIGKL
jgi:hypothetical protein